MGRIIIGITGASGVVYGIRLMEALLESGYCLDVVITRAGARVIREELDLELEGPVQEQKSRILRYINKETFEKEASEKEASGKEASSAVLHEASFVLHDIENIGAVIASGSYKSDAMVIIPCTMGTLAAIACGLSSNLLERAADVTLKEGRKLLLVPRETPLNSIHLSNMLKLSQMGAGIIPPMPSFYIYPKSINDMVDFVVGKVLDQLSIEHNLYARWKGLKI